MASGWAVSHVILLSAVAASAFDDCKDGKILNAVTYPTLLVALFLSACKSLFGSSAIVSFSSIVLAQSVIGVAVCFVLMLAFYATGNMGAGDVKLSAAIGATLGWQCGVSVILWANALAIVVGILLAVRDEGLKSTLGTFANFCLKFLVPSGFGCTLSVNERILQRRMPMGVYFALGTGVVMLGGNLL